MLWDRPRPFEAGLGVAHLLHAASPSFPSSHATAYAALAFSFLLVADTAGSVGSCWRWRDW